MTGEDAPLVERLVLACLQAIEQRDPHGVDRAASRALLDVVACTRAGMRGVRPQADRGRALLLGTGVRAPAEQAAGLNAAAAHILDRDDLHWPSVTHPGGVVWPAVLALAEEAEADGERALVAAALGYEVTARLALALGPEHRRFWHATTTAGSVGAAAAAAWALGAREAAAGAAAHAASVAGGLMQALFERSGTRVFHRAHAATTGVTAARAAAGGLGGSAHVLEGERGLFAATAPDAGAAAALAPRERLAIEETTFRLYGASGFAHAAIDAARELGPAPGAEHVRVEAPPGFVALAGEPAPRSDEEAWWSIPHAVAVVLLGGEPDGALHEEALPLARAIELVAGEGPETTVTVDGRSATVLAHRGHHDNPATDDELAAKWRALVGSDPPLPRLRMREYERVSDLLEVLCETRST